MDCIVNLKFLSKERWHLTPKLILPRHDISFLPCVVLRTICSSRIIQYQTRIFKLPLTHMTSSRIWPAQAIYHSVELTKCANPAGPDCVYYEQATGKPLRGDIFVETALIPAKIELILSKRRGIVRFQEWHFSWYYHTVRRLDICTLGFGIVELWYIQRLFTNECTLSYYNTLYLYFTLMVCTTALSTYANNLANIARAW